MNYETFSCDLCHRHEMSQVLTVYPPHDMSAYVVPVCARCEHAVLHRMQNRQVDRPMGGPQTGTGRPPRGER